MTQDSPAATPEPPEPPEGPPPPPPPPPRKRRVGLTVTLVIVAVVGLLCVVSGFLAVSFMNAVRGEIPEAGDCLTEAPDPTDMDVVGCDADGAAWTVLGLDRVVTRGEFGSLTDDEVCQEHESTEQALWVTDAWIVDDGTDGQVVCLESLGED